MAPGTLRTTIPPHLKAIAEKFVWNGQGDIYTTLGPDKKTTFITFKAKDANTDHILNEELQIARKKEQNASGERKG